MGSDDWWISTKTHIGNYRKIHSNLKRQKLKIMVYKLITYSIPTTPTCAYISTGVHMKYNWNNDNLIKYTCRLRVLNR